MTERRRARGARAPALRLAITLAVATASGYATAAPPAHAAAPSDHDAAFKSGLEQFSRANYVAAIATWESLLRTIGEDRGYKALFNVGLAYQAIGDVTRAIERYHAFLERLDRKGTVPPELAARGADARRRVRQLESAHGAVRVRPPKSGGLVLTRIGTGEPRAAGYVVWLAPGGHTVELFVGTERATRVAVDVAEGSVTDVETTPPDPPPTADVGGRHEAASPFAAPSETKPPARREVSTAWVLAGLGASAASLALPLLSYHVASQRHDDLATLDTSAPEYRERLDDYRTWRTVYFASYAVPATLALATLSLVVFRPTFATKAAVGLGPASGSLRVAF